MAGQPGPASRGAGELQTERSGRRCGGCGRSLAGISLLEGHSPCLHGSHARRGFAPSIPAPVTLPLPDFPCTLHAAIWAGDLSGLSDADLVGELGCTALQASWEGRAGGLGLTLSSSCTLQKLEAVLPPAPHSHSATAGVSPPAGTQGEAASGAAGRASTPTIHRRLCRLRPL